MMKRSEINRVYRDARDCFAHHCWVLPPNPRWDITDYALGDFDRAGLTLINLAEEKEYCEKLMYARRGQVTPCHAHRRKKEDVICRNGALQLKLWGERPEGDGARKAAEIKLNGEPKTVPAGEALVLQSGERVTLPPGVWHEFEPVSDECIIGEVSTANDDENDNFFVDERVGRFPEIEEDEAAQVRLLSEREANGG